MTANRLVQMYRHEAGNKWKWYESYLTYANSVLPEAMLCAWLSTGELVYKEVAKSSFDFLLSKIFTEKNIKVISNKGRLHKGEKPEDAPVGGQQECFSLCLLVQEDPVLFCQIYQYYQVSGLIMT